MRKTKIYNLTDKETGKVIKNLTAKECQAIIGKNVNVGKYCTEGKAYMRRWKFEETDKTLEDSEISANIKSPFDLKLYNEWNKMRELFKNVEWVHGGGK